MQPWSGLCSSESSDPRECTYGHPGNFLFVWLKFVETDVHQMNVSSSINKPFFFSLPKQNISLSESFQLTAQLSQRPAVLKRNEFLDLYPHGKILLQLWLASAWKLKLCLEHISTPIAGHYNFPNHVEWARLEMHVAVLKKPAKGTTS